jgi:hypothetical protein
MIEVKHRVRNDRADFIQTLIQFGFILRNELIVPVAVHPRQHNYFGILFGKMCKRAQKVIGHGPVVTAAHVDTEHRIILHHLQNRLYFGLHSNALVYRA